MKTDDQLLEEIEETIIQRKKKKKPKIAWSTIINYQLKRYDEALINKLPNEFRSHFYDYNSYNSNTVLLIDTNKYSHF